MTSAFLYFCLAKFYSMKRFSFVVFLLVSLSASLTLAQSEKDAFLYIDNNPVYAEEFIRLYQRNLNIITEEEQKDLDNYLDLFITYKLKLVEAKELGLDKEDEYLKDITAYRKDLTLRYLEDSKITETILEEMYQRSMKEVHASHILINIPPYAYGVDTIKTYERVNALRERAIAGEDFNQLAEKYSEDPDAKRSKGDLGYFSTMQMVMPFENAAYTTPIDEISPIIRTGYGYHFLKVHGERPVENKLDAAHIMVMRTKDSVADEKRIQEAYVALQSGRPFAEVAKEYSQDEITSVRGGQLDPFGRKDIRLQVFTDTAYSLEEGTFSAPFLSDIGWHIVKLNKRVPHPSKEEMLEEIKTFFESSGTSAFYDQKKYDKLLPMLNYEQLSHSYAADLLPTIDRDYLIKKREPIHLSTDKNKKMFKLDAQVFYYNDFLEYLSGAEQYATEGMRTEQILHSAFDSYKKAQALEDYGNKLYRENKNYAASVEDYHNGLLLFNLMQEQVWQKAAKDTIAQKEYYNKHQTKFDLPESWEVVVYSTMNEDTARAIHEKLKSSVEKEEINKDFAIKPVVENWTKESDGLKLKNFKSGEALVLIQEGQDYKVVEIQKHFPPAKRDFTSARNDVVQSYSLEFEEQWVNTLRKKYKVKLKKKKWKDLKSNLM